MDHHQLSQQQGYQHHPCYNQDNPGHNLSIHGHNQDSFHHQYNHGGTYDTYSTHQHQTQFSPEYQDCFVKSEPEDYKYSSTYDQQYYGAYSDIDKYKLERKRERNRIAATKCRMRKLEKIAQLDTEVGQLKEQNLQLAKEGDCLRGELRQLKDILKKHVESGECRLAESGGHNPDSTS